MSRLGGRLRCTTSTGSPRSTTEIRRIPAAWRDAIARAQRHPRQRDAVADVIAAQQRRRNAAPSAVAAARAAPRPADRRGRHRPAGRPLRRTAVHAAESHHGHPPGGAGPRDAPRAGGRDLLGRRRGPRLGRGPVVLRARRRRRVAQHRPSPVAASSTRPVGRVTLDDHHRGRPRRPESLASRHRVHAPPARRPRRASTARASACRRPSRAWIESLLGPLGLVVYESSDPATKPLVADLFAREIAMAGASARRASRGRGARWRRPAITPRSPQPRAAWRSSA